MYKLPTYQEGMKIVSETDSFYVSEKIINGCKVAMFDYRLATISDFKKYNAFELRGLTFVQEDGEWKRWLLLEKFFNIDQTEGWMLDDVKDKKIVEVQEKLDGSVISFVKIDGKVFAKSKMSFESDQAMMAQEIYETNQSIKELVDLFLMSGLNPIFELISPNNQIVVEYDKTELRLLKIRTYDGKYLTKEEVMWLANKFGVKYAAYYDYTLEELLKMKETNRENIEGCVIKFEDNQLAKIKTNRYLELHHLIGPDAMRENLIVKTILDGNIDDVISNLTPGAKREKIKYFEEIISHEFNHLVQRSIELREMYKNYNSRKEFVEAIREEETFSVVMRLINSNNIEKDTEELVKEYIIRQTKSLSDAKKYLKQKGKKYGIEFQR